MPTRRPGRAPASAARNAVSSPATPSATRRPPARRRSARCATQACSRCASSGCACTNATVSSIALRRAATAAITSASAGRTRPRYAKTAAPRGPRRPIDFGGSAALWLPRPATGAPRPHGGAPRPVRELDDERSQRMGVPVRITVNGEAREADVEPRLLLVHFLRDSLGLTGTHVGCDTSNFGACTVHLDGEAVKSCTILAVQADGAEVTTIEGMGTDGALHPLQEAFWADHGL